MAGILTLYVGLPGSGKTTAAKEAVKAADPGTVVRSNRDELSRMMFGYAVTEQRLRNVITCAQYGQIQSLLVVGTNVICDDTNLVRAYRESLAGYMIEIAGAHVEYRSFMDVPLETCLARNDSREGAERIDPDIIRRMQTAHAAEGVHFRHGRAINPPPGFWRV